MAEEGWNKRGDGTGCQPRGSHRLCANNCRFFGSPATMNLCSKSYRDLQLKGGRESTSHCSNPLQKPLSLVGESTAAAVESRHAAPSLEADVTFISSSSSSLVVTSASPDSGKSNRCFSCKKWVGHIGFKCKCGSKFCASHRLPEKHVCDFNYRTADREAIAKANPAIRVPKLDKI